MSIFKENIIWYRQKKTMKLICQYTILVASAIMFAFPLFWMISTSLKIDKQIFAFPIVWIPHPVAWYNYVETVNYIPFLRYFGNTMFYAVFSVVGIMLSSSLVAYSLSRIEWPGRNVFFAGTLATIMLPFTVTMVPLFIFFSRLNWIDSFKPLIIPYWFGHPFYIFLLRQFFLTIPKELSDAAKIDGCSELGIYWRIIMPLSKAALTVAGVFTFMFCWHDFLGPLIYINSQDKFTLALGMNSYLSQYGSEWALLMAAGTLMTLPIIIIFFLTQRTFIQGISLTGIKE